MLLLKLQPKVAILFCYVAKGKLGFDYCDGQLQEKSTVFFHHGLV